MNSAPKPRTCGRRFENNVKFALRSDQAARAAMVTATSMSEMLTTQPTLEITRRRMKNPAAVSENRMALIVEMTKVLISIPAPAA